MVFIILTFTLALTLKIKEYRGQSQIKDAPFIKALKVPSNGCFFHHLLTKIPVLTFWLSHYRPYTKKRRIFPDDFIKFDPAFRLGYMIYKSLIFTMTMTVKFKLMRTFSGKIHIFPKNVIKFGETLWSQEYLFWNFDLHSNLCLQKSWGDSFGKNTYFQKTHQIR